MMVNVRPVSLNMLAMNFFLRITLDAKIMHLAIGLWVSFFIEFFGIKRK
jgi:hypothetical protein